MIKTTLFTGVLLVCTSAFSQLFSDNFDSYTNGALGPQSLQWTTWSGTEGGAEDGIVTTNQASSPTKSVYFNSTTSGGGPQDCVLKFGALYNSGIFTYESKFYVNTNKTAYFNFQGSQTIGSIWALNVNMANGLLTIDDGITPDLAMAPYSPATWFTLRIEANLTLGRWEAFVDGTSIGVWENGVNTLASVDFYPLQGSQFYVDDVLFDHTTYTLPSLNAAVSGLNMGGNIATQIVDPVITVMNAGSTTINSFDITLDYNGTPYTQNITGLNLASLASYTVNYSGIALVAGSNPAVATVSNINAGGADDDATDDIVTINVNPFVPAPGKMVVGEEATGTWCQWCPRGAVYMDMYEAKYDGFWAGIAVHNGDPMAVSMYDTGLNTLFTGYPSALVDRTNDVDPSGMATDFWARLQTPPAAFITNGAVWNPSTRVLDVSVSADFQIGANNTYKLACVLTEDGVTGTTGYSQSNAYAGGSNGVMGGYESLPNPVPAAQMVYDHVARVIAPAFTGEPNSFPAVVNSGETHTLTFSFTLPASWNENNVNIVGLLIAPNGKIDNADKTTIPEAVTNGYVFGPAASVTEINADQVDNTFNLYPNPTVGNAVVSLNLKSETNVEIVLRDMSGKLIKTRNFGKLFGGSNIELGTSELNSGVYFVEVILDNQKMTKRLIKE